jgi:hypothetical protein
MTGALDCLAPTGFSGAFSMAFFSLAADAAPVVLAASLALFFFA